MNRYIKNILMPLSALVVVAACSESDVQELFPDAYKKILYIKDGGEECDALCDRTRCRIHLQSM